jgi:hypothetical protein
MNEAMKTAWLEISQMLGEPTREELDVFLRTWQRAMEAQKQPAQQELVADGLIRQYINSLVANKPDEAANTTKAMVDYVYTSPPAQQEPVAKHYANGGHLVYPKAQRPWVGLTDEEVGDLSDFAYANDEEFVRNVEAKLKQKNGGVV